jgi:hypothetical protein
MHQPEENPWQIVSQKEVYSNPWIALTEYQVINPSGNSGIYGKVHYKNIAIGIIPLDDEMNTYLVASSAPTHSNQLNANCWKKPA